MVSAGDALPASPVVVDEPVIFINVQQTFRPGMSDLALYEAIRGMWKMGV